MSDLHIRYPGSRGFPPLAPGVGLVMIAGDVCDGLDRAIREMRSAYTTPLAIVVTVPSTAREKGEP